MAASQVIVPVLFTAKADAPLAGRAGRGSRASRPTPSSKSPRNSPRCRCSSWARTSHCLDPDRRPAGGGRDRRVPLLDRDRRAQGAAGARRLDGARRFVANRKPGFKAAISVYLPWNPPGVGSAGGIAIPERPERGASSR